MYICENVTFKVSFKFHWTPGLENQPQTFSELPVSWGRAKALGFGQSARHHGGCPRNTRPPAPGQGHVPWYPVAAAMLQVGVSGPWGVTMTPVSLDRELWEIMPRPGVLLWRGPRSHLWNLGPLLPAFSQLSSHPLLGLLACFLS